MKDLKVSKNFYLWEFVPPDIYERFGENSIWFIDPKIIKVAQFLRNLIEKPVTINSWKHYADHSGYRDSGFRNQSCKYWSAYSQHSFGRAIDVHVDDQDYECLRESIRCSWSSVKKRTSLTTIEKDTPTWMHMDVRPTNLEELFEVAYKKKVKKSPGLPSKENTTGIAG